MAEDFTLTGGAERDWRNEVSARGGHVGSYPFNPYNGSLGAFFDDDTVVGGRRWEVAPLAARLGSAYTGAVMKVNVAEGKVAEAAGNVAGDLGLDRGVTGFIGKIFGIPHGVVVALAVTGSAVAVYALLVQAGILPPIANWTEEK